MVNCKIATCSSGTSLRKMAHALIYSTACFRVFFSEQNAYLRYPHT